MDYLRRIRKRPLLRKPEEEDAAPSLGRVDLEKTPAAGKEFAAACARQCEDVTVHGLLAAFRSKAWVLAQGWSVSLGTVGVERLWRNLQRMARNHGRGRASVRTVNLLLLLRWIRSVHARLVGAGHGQESRARRWNAAYHEQYCLAWDRLAASILDPGGSAVRPLTGQGALGSGSVPLSTLRDVCGGLTEAGIGQVYDAFATARFLTQSTGDDVARGSDACVSQQ